MTGDNRPAPLPPPIAPKRGLVSHDGGCERDSVEVAAPCARSSGSGVSEVDAAEEEDDEDAVDG